MRQSTKNKPVSARIGGSEANGGKCVFYYGSLVVKFSTKNNMKYGDIAGGFGSNIK